MSKKNIIITIAVCVVCSAASFLVGYNLPRNKKTDNKSPQVSEAQKDNNTKTPPKEVASEADDKYKGIYIAEYYSGNKPITDKIYLNDNHDCSSPDNTNAKTSCKWALRDNRLILTRRGGGGSLFKTTEECQADIERLKRENGLPYNGGYYTTIGYEVIDLSDEKRENGITCMVSSIDEDKYDILSDGSLSAHNKIYQKRK